MRVTVIRADGLVRHHARVVRAAQLGPLLRSSGDALGVPARAALSVLLTDDDALRRLNREFLATDEATDVLAFPADERDRVGDIAISVERAVAQAPDAPAEELRLLAVHGLLHCLGHDHASRADAQRMTDATRALLPRQSVPSL